jgi:hypothetical protein
MDVIVFLVVGSVVAIFALLAFAPLVLDPVPEETPSPRLRLIEGGQSDVHQDAA